MTTRRQILLGAASLFISARAAAQARNHRVGLIGYSAASAGPFFLAFTTALAELGYREGQNLIVERRYIDGRPDRLPALAAELVNSGVEVVLVGGELSAHAVKSAKPDLPIVMVWSLDPVGQKLAASLARPGGTVTGLTFHTGTELAAKELQLIKEAVPTISRIALVWDPASVGQAAYARRVGEASKSLGLEMSMVEVRSAADVTPALDGLRKSRPNALWIWGSPILSLHRNQIVEFAIKERMPAFGVIPYDVEQGCLMSYSVDMLASHRRSAGFVAKILKGAKPGDLPIEQPTQYQLVVNLKTAKAIGITIPQSILLRADRVIE